MRGSISSASSPVARHVEVQIFGDGKGRVRRAGRARLLAAAAQSEGGRGDAGAGPLRRDARRGCTQAAVALGRSVNYESAGTVEFIYDVEREDFYFLEVNTRLQVEHPVTEAVFGVDLVEWMMRQAAGEQRRSTLRAARAAGRGDRSAALCRESATPTSAPAPACSPRSRFPRRARIDGWIETGTEVTPFYDPMLAKIIVHADDRAAAIAKLQRRARDAPRSRASRPISIICAPSPAPTCFASGDVATTVLRELRLRAATRSRCSRRARRSERAGTAGPPRLCGMSACRRRGPMDERSLPPRQPARRQCRRRPRRSNCTVTGPTLRFHCRRGRSRWPARGMPATLDGVAVRASRADRGHGRADAGDRRDRRARASAPISRCAAASTRRRFWARARPSRSARSAATPPAR